MFRVRGTFLIALIMVLSLVTSTAMAQDFSFEPWSDVTQVCPTCEPPPADEIELADGEVVEGTIRAINPEFYTLERFGEVRTVPADDVENVEWKRGDQPDDIDELDQIVLENGHVLTGEITIENERPPYYEIESSYLDHSYTVFVSQIAHVFRDGEQYDFESAMDDVSDIREDN